MFIMSDQLSDSFKEVKQPHHCQKLLNHEPFIVQDLSVYHGVIEELLCTGRSAAQASLHHAAKPAWHQI